VLLAAHQSQYMPEFAASLPLSATDGTLKRRFRSPQLQGRLRMKTGNLDDVSALAGYVNAASGRTYIAVIVLNHPGVEHGAGIGSAHHGADAGQCGQRAVIARGGAAHDHGANAWTLPRDAAHERAKLGLARVRNGAGIHDCHVGVLKGAGGGRAGIAEGLANELGVVLIRLTTEGVIKDVHG